MRARMALLLARIPFDAHDVILRDKPAAMLAVSPKGTVPVLVLPDRRVLEQSWQIVEWALTHDRANAQAQSWWSRAQSADNLALLHCNDGDFKRHLDRYKYPERFSAEGNTDTAAFDMPIGHRDQAVATLLQPLEQRLTQQPFLGGAQPCATDLGIFPFIRQFAAVNPAWFDNLPFRQVKTWLSYWLQSPLFVACMHKLPSNVVEPFPMACIKQLP